MRKNPNWIRSLIRLLSYTKQYKLIFGISLISVILISFIGPLRPYLIGKAVDLYIVKSTDSEALLLSLTGIFGLLILEALLMWSATYHSNLFAQSVIRDLRNEVYMKMLRFKFQYFDQTPVGAIVTRIVSDVEAIAEVFSSGFMEIMADFLSLITILSMMFLVDWKLTLLTLIPIPFLLIATRIFAKAMKTSFQMERTQVSRLNVFIQERLMGMFLIQIFTKVHSTEKDFQEINQQHRQAHIKAVWANSIFFPIVELLSSLSIAFLLVWGALLVEGKDQQELSALFGTIISFTLWIQQLYRPIRQIADKFNILQRGVVRAERIFDVLDDQEHLEEKDQNQLPFVAGDIVFDQVDFGYTEENPLLKKFNLTIESGKTTALVGATGSGKTTITNLLGRFYEIQSGFITVGGTDIRQIPRSQLNRNIGFVLQDVFLFSDTIHENITLNNPNINRKAVIEASKTVGAHEFIMKLPGGYDYKIGERGGALSVGQRQLLAFIRVMVYQPTILVLDEATSSIDSETELLIQKAITEVTKNRTSIVIAHRLSTIKQAHCIGVMQGGELIESGTHESLLAAKGAYYLLHEHQFKPALP